MKAVTKFRFLSEYSHKEVEIEIPTEVVLATVEFLDKYGDQAEVVISIDGLYRVRLHRWWDRNPMVIIRDIRAPDILCETSLDVLLRGYTPSLELVRKPSLVKRKILETKVKLAFLLFDLHLIKSFGVQDQKLKIVWKKKRR